jgi:hypothetical protein
MAACRLLSPDIREGMRFKALVRPHDVDCPSELALELYYTGDTGDVFQLKSFSGKVTGAEAAGDQAVVSVRMTYKSDESAKTYVTKTLAVRRDGRWWVATPGALNLLSAIKGLSEKELQAAYRQYLHQAALARTQHRAGEQATRTVDRVLQPCPAGVMSSARDAAGDVRIADGGELAHPQPRSADLVAVTHSRDGDQLCFQLRFRGAAPREGSAELAIRPHDRRVSVEWTKDARVVGESTLANNAFAKPVIVEASRAGDSITLRAPRAMLSGDARRYRWAVESGVGAPGGERSYYDSVPDNLSVSVAPERDHYIPHPQP